MRLSDVVSHLDISIFPEISLALFLGVFIAVGVRAWRMGRAESARCASLFEDPPRSDIR